MARNENDLVSIQLNGTYVRILFSRFRRAQGSSDRHWTKMNKNNIEWNCESEGLSLFLTVIRWTKLGRTWRFSYAFKVLVYRHCRMQEMSSLGLISLADVKA